jgi:hypothetical protein
MVLVSEQTFQAWYYRSIPHNFGRDFLPGTFFALNIAKVISSDLIPRRFAYGAFIQILVVLATV